MRLHRPHLNLAAKGNYMMAWTTPFKNGHEIDALTQREHLEKAIDDVSLRFWDHRVRVQHTVLRNAYLAAGNSASLGSVLREHNVRNRYMQLSLKTDIFIRRARTRLLSSVSRLREVRNDIVSQRDRIREAKEDLGTQKRQLCGDIEKEIVDVDIRSLSDPVSRLMIDMRTYPEKPVSLALAQRAGDGYCRSIWSTYRKLKTSNLRRGDSVRVFNSIGNPKFLPGTGVRRPFTIAEIQNPVPFSPADKVLKFLESIGLNSKSETVQIAMTLCGGLDAILCAISRDMFINPPSPDSSGSIQRLEIYSSCGGVTYNEFTEWVLFASERRSKVPTPGVYVRARQLLSQGCWQHLSW